MAPAALPRRHVLAPLTRRWRSDIRARRAPRCRSARGVRRYFYATPFSRFFSYAGYHTSATFIPQQFTRDTPPFEEEVIVYRGMFSVKRRPAAYADFPRRSRRRFSDAA